MAKLIYTDKGVEQEFSLDSGRAAYTIGRNPMCDLRINNPSISRKHAEIRVDAASGRYSIYDLNSSNGTYVNGARESSAAMTSGDEILCGEFALLFIDEPVGGETLDADEQEDSKMSAQGFFGDDDQRPSTPPPPPPHPPAPQLPPNQPAAAPGQPSVGGTIAGHPVEFDGADLLPPPTDQVERQPPAEQPAPAADHLEGTAVEERDLLKVEVRSLKDELQELRLASSLGEALPAEDFAKELDIAAAEMKSLRVALQKEAQRADEAESEKANLSAELKKALDAAKAATEAAAKTADQLAAAGAELKELRAKAERTAALEAAAKDKDAKITALEAAAKGQNERIAQLESARSGSKPGGADAAELERLQQKNAAMRAAFKDLSAELQNLIEANRKLIADLEAHKSTKS